MTDLIRAELAVLIAAYDEHGGKWTQADEEALFNAVDRARAVLQRCGTPMASDVIALERLVELERGGEGTAGWGADLALALAAARAARPAALADGPAVPEGREPAAVAGEPSDEELLQVAELAAHIDYGGLADAMAEGYPLEVTAIEVLEICRAVLARWGRPAAPPAPVAGEVVEALAARPLLEQVAAIGDCISEQTVGRVRVLADRASAWLAENPPGQPVAIEPRGCPMPGACSCVELPTPATGEVGELVAELRRICCDVAPCDFDQLTRAAELLRHQAAEVDALRGRLSRAISLLSADLLERQAAPQPVAVSERLPGAGVKVLAHYVNDLGKGRTICAIWVPAKTRGDSYGNDDFTEYDEETDAFYWPEGWYEAIENWDDLGYVKVDEGDVIYWQPLPQWPADALPIPATTPAGQEGADGLIY